MSHLDRPRSTQSKRQFQSTNCLQQSRAHWRDWRNFDFSGSEVAALSWSYALTNVQKRDCSSVPEPVTPFMWSSSTGVWRCVLIWCQGAMCTLCLSPFQSEWWSQHWQSSATSWLVGYLAFDACHFAPFTWVLILQCFGLWPGGQQFVCLDSALW